MMNPRNRKVLMIGFKAGQWTVKAPFKLGKFVAKAIGGWILMTRDSLPCLSCGQPVVLYGRYECGWCDFTWDGFYFSACPCCGATPPYVKCSCGAGIRNPML